MKTRERLNLADRLNDVIAEARRQGRPDDPRLERLYGLAHRLRGHRVDEDLLDGLDDLVDELEEEQASRRIENWRLAEETAERLAGHVDRSDDFVRRLHRGDVTPDELLWLDEAAFGGSSAGALRS